MDSSSYRNSCLFVNMDESSGHVKAFIDSVGTLKVLIVENTISLHTLNSFSPMSDVSITRIRSRLPLGEAGDEYTASYVLRIIQKMLFSPASETTKSKLLIPNNSMYKL